jgi:hypothetical protein
MMTKMKEGELAEQIESMRDDPDAWGDPEPDVPVARRKSEKRQRVAMVSVRLNPDELSALQAHALRVGSTVSAYLRDVAVHAAHQPIIVSPWKGSAAVNSSATDERLLVLSGFSNLSLLSRGSRASE